MQSFIMAPVPVATRGRRTKGRLRWPPGTELCRSRKSANDGSVVGRSKLASFDHLVGAGEGGTARPSAFSFLRLITNSSAPIDERPSPPLLDQLGAKTSVLDVGYRSRLFQLIKFGNFICDTKANDAS